MGNGILRSARLAAGKIDKGAFMPTEEEIWGKNGLAAAIRATWSPAEAASRALWAVNPVAEITESHCDDRHHKVKPPSQE